MTMNWYVDPASETFTTLSRRERGRIYLSLGWTVAAVADELNVKPATVRDWLTWGTYEKRLAKKRVAAKKRHLPYQGYEGGKLSRHDRETVCKRREAGEKLEVLAVEYGVSISTIWYHTKNMPKPEGGWPTGRRPEVDRDLVVKLRRQGLAIVQIAERLDVGHSVVGKICKTLNAKRGKRIAA